MKIKRFATLLLSLCLAAQLNFCSANPNYDEEITLPLGTNFDLEMEEITRYEYDGNYVKAQTVNGKEQFILQKTGDTIITVVLEEKGQKTEMKVLVHIVTEQQFNGTSTTTAPATSTTKPAAKASTAPAKTTAATQPAAKEPAKAPAQVQPTTPTKTEAPATAPATPAKASEPAKQETKAPAPTTPAQTEKPATTAPAQAQKPATAPATKPAEPVKPVTARYGTTITRSQAPAANNSIEAAKFKINQNAFDVLDLVNAERAKNGLNPLVMVKDLYAAAEIRSKEIPKRFTHTRPDNTRYFTVYTNLGTCQEENIAAGQPTAEAVVKAWLSMPTSRNNILNPNYTEIGVGYFEAVAANYPCYWVQLFRG